MSIKVDCECGNEFLVADSRAGREIACTACSLQFCAPIGSFSISIIHIDPNAGRSRRFLVNTMVLTSSFFLLICAWGIMAGSPRPNDRPTVQAILETQPTLKPIAAIEEESLDALARKKAAASEIARKIEEADQEKWRLHNAELRAADLNILGWNLENVGKPALAIEYYRRVSSEFRYTPSAKYASDRIMALTPH
jgi:hypothetical protein